MESTIAHAPACLDTGHAYGGKVVRVDVVGTGMVAHAFGTIATDVPAAIICASGVADSETADASAFRRERELLTTLARQASETHAVLVYFSAASVYGDRSRLRIETGPAIPRTPYGWHKLECERLVAGSAARYLILRLPNVVGSAGNPRQLVPSLITQAVAGSVVVRTDATRDLLDVDDLVAITADLLRCGATDAILNVASGVSTSVPRLVEHINSILGVAPAVTLVGGGDRQEFSIAMARQLLRTYPHFTDSYPIEVLLRRAPSIRRSLRERALI
jgi:nucleoside-diphosphate-sugar epimerase